MQGRTGQGNIMHNITNKWDSYSSPTVIAIYNDIYFLFEMDLFLTLAIYFKQLYILFMIEIFC